MDDYTSVFIGENPDGHFIRLPVDFSAEKLANFRPIGWYSMYGRRSRWQRVLGALKYYKFRWWLGWGKEYQPCNCNDCDPNTEDWYE